MGTRDCRPAAGRAGPRLARVFSFIAIMAFALAFSARAWAAAAANINFKTLGLPAGVSITISGSRTTNGGPVQPYTVTFSSPGPSANTGCAPTTGFSYSGFPSSVTSPTTTGTTTYVLCSTSPASPSTTGIAGSTTTVTATYSQLAITCPADTTVECPNPTDPSATGVATSSGDCLSAAVITHNDSTAAGNCAGNYVITRTWTATDTSGNTATCAQTITVQDTTAPTIGSPGDNATIQCPATPEFTPPTASDNCDSNPAVVLVSDDITPGTCAGTYTETKTWKAVDACSNESGTVSQTITVVDTTPPIITCPPSLVNVPADTGLCSASSVGVGTATATDTCTCDVNISGVRSDALGLSDPYPVGTTTITWTATDAAGLQDTCLQTVEVTDTQNPTIIACAPNKSLTIRSTETSTPANPGAPIVSDNCGIFSVVGVRDDGMGLNDPYPAGPTPGTSKTTTITWTVTDVNGNQATCQSTITVTRRPS